MAQKAKIIGKMTPEQLEKIKQKKQEEQDIIEKYGSRRGYNAAMRELREERRVKHEEKVKDIVEHYGSMKEYVKIKRHKKEAFEAWKRSNSLEAAIIDALKISLEKI